MTAVVLALFVLITRPPSPPPPIADWLPPNQPLAIEFDNSRAVVDLYLNPEQPVRLLISNVDLNEGAAVLNASVAPLHDWPKYRPAAIQPEVESNSGALKVNSSAVERRGSQLGFLDTSRASSGATERNQTLLAPVIGGDGLGVRGLGDARFPLTPSSSPRSTGARGAKSFYDLLSSLEGNRSLRLLDMSASAGTSSPHLELNVDLKLTRSSVGNDSVTQGTECNPQNTRDFWLHVGDTPLEDRQGYRLVQGRLAECTRSVEVYVDRSLLDAKTATSALDLKVTELVQRLQAEVLPAIANHIGPIPDPDGNERLTVLLTPWLGRLRGGTVSVRGFVRSSDFRPDLPAPFSNHADLLYLNSDLPTGPALTTLLLHEVAHAALARQSSNISGRSTNDWDDWLNEGLAHLAERRCGGDWSNIGFRIARYWESPATSPLVVRDYYRSGRWRDHGCRGATFLFLDWCERHSIRRGVSRFTPVLVKTDRSGPDAIEAICHTNFSDLYRAWTISMATAFSESAEQASVDTIGKKGPRFDHWDVTRNPQQSFTIWNTATQFRELRTSRAGWYRLTFHSPQTTTWQCTVIQSTTSMTTPPRTPVPVQTVQRAVGVVGGL